MSVKLYLFLITGFVIVNVASADIFGDIFKSIDIFGAFSDGAEEEEAAQREDEDSSLQNTCECKGMKCDCCVDFNVSSILDFGGPGCVNIKYLSKEKGVLLNVSYGESILHSQTVTSLNKKGTCMTLLSYVAEICARFSDLKEKDDGMVGCLNFEPTVFGEVTGQYPVGCFRMGPEGMHVDETINTNNSKENEGAGKAEVITTEKPEEEQSFLETVNQTAQEGFEFFSNLLGLNFNSKKNSKNSTVETKAEEEEDEEEESSRGKKNENFILKKKK